MNNTTKVTVLMPAYNAQEYIGAAIRSVLKQSFTDFELLIVNNGSTDETESIITSFSDSRIRLVNQPDKGIAIALNTGILHARGTYIARFDADDICHPQRLEIQYRFMSTHPDYVISGTACDYTDMHGEHIFTYQPPGYTDEDIRKVKRTICPFIHSSVIYKKEYILKLGGYPTNAHNFEDHILWLKLLEQGKAFNLAQPLIQVRLNPGSVTIDERWRLGAFTKIKHTALKKGDITEAEGNRLLEIITRQDTLKIKEGAYYSLLAKKFLWNNYQPRKARENLKKVLSLNSLEWRSYVMFALSYLPESVLLKLYQSLK